MFRSTRRNAVSCVISLTNSVHQFPPCSRVGLLTTSPPTSCCENAMSLLAHASFCPAPFNGSPSSVGRDWPITRISRGWSRGSGPVRRSGSSALAGFVLFRLSTSSLFTMRTFAERIGLRFVTSRRRWMPPYGETFARRAATSTQRRSGRTTRLHLRAPGCGAGRGERTGGGRRSGASHPLRDVSPVDTLGSAGDEQWRETLRGRLVSLPFGGTVARWHGGTVVC